MHTYCYKLVGDVTVFISVTKFLHHMLRGALILYRIHIKLLPLCVLMYLLLVLLLQAQQSLNSIHSKISLKAAGDTVVIENSDISPEMVGISFSLNFLGLVNSEEQACSLAPNCASLFGGWEPTLGWNPWPRSYDTRSASLS